MSRNFIDKVGACIIRRNRESLHELLLFRHEDLPEVPVQIPGGTVETGLETIEEAVHREVLEESGLTDLKLLRKICTFDWYWTDKNKWLTRHVYLLEAPPETADTWIHTVSGTGSDAKLRFAYHWHRLTPDFKLGGGFDPFLNTTHLPELF